MKKAHIGYSLLAVAGITGIGVYNFARYIGGVAQAEATERHDRLINSRLAVSAAEGSIRLGAAQVDGDRFRTWIPDGEEGENTGIVIEYNFASQRICEGTLEDPSTLMCGRTFNILSGEAVATINMLACETAASQKQEDFILSYCPN